MRLNPFPSTAAAAVCGTLALLIAGPALASDAPPATPGPAAAESLDTVGNLGETLLLASRIGTEARSKTPDTAALQELQRRLRSTSGRLQRSVKAADRAAEVPAQLKKLDDDVTALLRATGSEDTAGVTTGVTAVVTDERALLGSVPKLLPAAA